MLLQTFLCKLLVLWPHLLLSVVLAVSGLGDGRGGMSTFLVYGLVVRGVWVYVCGCACFVAFLVVHGALHEGKLMAPSGKLTHPYFSFPCAVPRAR